MKKKIEKKENLAKKDFLVKNSYFVSTKNIQKKKKRRENC